MPAPQGRSGPENRRIYEAAKSLAGGAMTCDLLQEA